MCFIQFLHWTNWLLLVTLSNFHFQGRVFWDFLQKEATAMAKIPVVLAIHATNDRLSSYDDVSILVLHGIKLRVAVGTWLKPMRTIRLGELISPFFIWELRSTSRQLWNDPVFVIYISSIFIYHFISIREFHASGTIFNFKVGEDTLPLRFPLHVSPGGSHHLHGGSGSSTKRWVMCRQVSHHAHVDGEFR